MNSWFDIYGSDSDEFSYNLSDIQKNAKIVESVIEDEFNYVKDYRNIYIGGFSQGAILTSYLGVSYKE